MLANPTLVQNRDIDEAGKKRLIDHYNPISKRRVGYRRLNGYYYKELLRHFKRIIPKDRTIFEAGCGDGFLLRELHPKKGLGIDLSPEMIREAKENSKGDKQEISFQAGDIENYISTETFDFIVASDLLGDLFDIQAALECMYFACHSETRLVIHFHNTLWEPVIKLAQKLGLKTPQLNHNWMNKNDIENLLELANFELVSFERKILFPIGIPLLSGLFNRCLAHLPGIKNFCLINFIIARKKDKAKINPKSVSIVIPCRNEKGTIFPALERLPQFGSAQEIIFVDGHSTDGTPEEIERVIKAYPEKEILFLKQEGKGKGDAVRLAFDHASKDILVILDADLSVPPEDLSKFYNAIASNKAEFINGSRLVYPMEKEAMRFLNILGNHFFSRALTWLLNQPLKDTLCGTKVLFRSDYLKIKANRSYFGDFDPFGDFDLLFGAVKQNLKIMEIPVRYRERVYGTTNISRFRHGLLLLRMVAFGFLKLKW